MKLIRTYATRLKVFGQFAYTDDPDQFVLNEITQKYQGVCYDASLITKILKINKYSEFEISEDERISPVLINVEFTAEAEVYNQHDIIPVCVVTKINDNKSMMSCQSEFCSIVVANSNIIGALHVGQKIPLQAISVSYKIGNRLTENSKPVAVVAQFPIIITPTLVPIQITEDVKSDFKDKFATIQYLEEELKKCSKSIVEEYDKCLYPFQNSKPSKGKEVKFNDIKKSDVVCYPPEESRRHYKLYHCQAEPIYQLTGDNFVNYTLYEHISHLILLLEIAKNHVSVKQSQILKLIWINAHKSKPE
jgi:hypothetical protein